jgi:dimethyladenosine transferase 2, mitochondrial
MSSKSEYLLPKFSKPCKELNNNEIINNLNIFTEFGELTPNQAFTIFHQFVNFPEFKHSNFGASLEQALIKSANTEVEENESETVVEEKDSK